MYIRPLVRDDIPAVSTIFCDAFENDAFFAFVAPYRHEYPQAWRSLAAKKQHTAICQPGMYGLVCVSDGIDGKGEEHEVLGFAWWTRKVPKDANGTDKYMLNNTSISAAVERLLRSVEAKYESWLCPNRSEYPAAWSIISRAADASNIWSPLEGVTHWHLSALAVSPRHHRKGVGRVLVNWGIQMAVEESLAAPDQPPVPATLTASGAGRGLYSQLGFKVIGWKTDIIEEWGRAMVFDPIQHRQELRSIYNRILSDDEIHTDGGSCMFFEPKGYWIEEASPGEIVNGKEVEAIWTSMAMQRLERLRDGTP